MKNHNRKTNEMLSEVVSLFLKNRAAVGHPNSLIDDSAQRLCSINLWELWVLTQD